MVHLELMVSVLILKHRKCPKGSELSADVKSCTSALTLDQLCAQPSEAMVDELCVLSTSLSHLHRTELFLKAIASLQNITEFHWRIHIRDKLLSKS